MGQLQTKSPQMASQIQQAMNNGSNPQALMKQMMENMNNNQIQNAMNQAKSMGIPDSILAQVQNIK